MLIPETLPGYTRLTLNRPEARNALNTALLAQLAQALTALASDKTVRAVVLTGANGHFAAGADITEIETKTTAEAAFDPRKAHWSTIRAFPKPLIVAIDGFALGGGFELALMADIIVLGPSAKLGLPETSLGLIPGAGGGQRLAALAGRARATRMILLGEIIDADTALSWGIAAFQAENALEHAEALATRLAARAPLALMAAKRALIASESSLSLDLERHAFESLLDTNDKTEGIRAFRDKRKPDFRGQ